MSKRYVIKLAGGAYFRDGASPLPTHWLDPAPPTDMIFGVHAGIAKDGSDIWKPMGFNQRIFHNEWKEQDKVTGKLVTKSADSLMILSQDCIGAQVVEAPDDLETVLSWTQQTRPTTINPGLAVREALGLSKEDAQEILGPDINVNDLDEGFYADLAGYASMAEKGEGELYLEIHNPDGTPFKRWRVTTDGLLVEGL